MDAHHTDDMLEASVSSPSNSGSLTPQSQGSPKRNARRNREVDAEFKAAGSAEHAPLLSPGYENASVEDSGYGDEDEEQTPHIYHEHEEETKSQWYLVALTLSIGGLQIAWSVELISITPFLLSLGLSKAIMALVWIAGPLSGTVVQPYVGIKSDNCRLRWGRRRPFIVGGALATMVSLLALSWTSFIVGGFLSIFGVARDSRGTTICSQIWAVLLVYILDFSINVVQAGIRAYIVDRAPTHQQEDANAWASRLVAVGSIIGNISGYVDLPKIVPLLGNTQFRVFTAIACISLIAAISISCTIVGESDARLLTEPSDKDGNGIFAFFSSLYRSLRGLPLQVRRVCYVQIFAWVGWFPFLFYITTYIGGIYAEPFFMKDPNMSEADVNEILEKGTRVGAFAMLIWSITTFVAIVALPFVIIPTYTAPTRPESNQMTSSASGSSSSHTGSRSGNDENVAKHVFRNSFSFRIRRAMSCCSPEMFQISSLTLRRAWLLSHILFAFLMWMTFFVHNTTGVIILVGANGIPWAITNWAPFALIAGEISKRDAIRRGLRPPPPTAEGQELAEGDDDGSAEQAGVVLGIHNVAIAAPQVIATLVSSIIFKVLQKPRGSPGDVSLPWVLRFGGLCALGAAWCTKLVGEGNAD